MPDKATAEELKMFQDLQPGDHVILYDYSGSRWLVQEVTKVTPARFHCGEFHCFRKRDGCEHDRIGSWPCWAYPDTPKYRQKVTAYQTAQEERRRQNALTVILRKTRFRTIPADRLQLALDILNGKQILLETLVADFLLADEAWRTHQMQCLFCRDWRTHGQQCEDGAQLCRAQGDLSRQLRDAVKSEPKGDQEDGE